MPSLVCFPKAYMKYYHLRSLENYIYGIIEAATNDLYNNSKHNKVKIMLFNVSLFIFFLFVNLPFLVCNFYVLKRPASIWAFSFIIYFFHYKFFICTTCWSMGQTLRRLFLQLSVISFLIIPLLFRSCNFKTINVINGCFGSDFPSQNSLYSSTQHLLAWLLKPHLNLFCNCFK